MIRNKTLLYIPGCINSYTLRMARIVQNVQGKILVILLCTLYYISYLLTGSVEQSPSWELTGSQLVKKFPHLMEPKFSLHHSQMPATCPYPQPIPVDNSTSETPVYVS